MSRWKVNWETDRYEQLVNSDLYSDDEQFSFNLLGFYLKSSVVLIAKKINHVFFFKLHRLKLITELSLIKFIAHWSCRPRSWPTISFSVGSLRFSQRVIWRLEINAFERKKLQRKANVYFNQQIYFSYQCYSLTFGFKIFCCNGAMC